MNTKKISESFLIELEVTPVITKISYLDYISIIKIIASYSVVILHSNNIFWTFNNKTYINYWISANLIESIFYFAVPFFILCIGATLLDFNEKYGIVEYYKKRFLKVVFPLLMWTYLLYFYKLYILKNKTLKIKSFVDFWNLYFGHKVYKIFGSFHDFLLLYLIIPLFAFIDKSKKIHVYFYGIFIILITQSLIPYLIQILEPKLLWVYDINAKNIIYLFIGYIIQNYSFCRKRELIIYFLGIYGFTSIFLGTHILTLKDNKINCLHKGYTNLPCILYSSASFLFIKKFNKQIIRIIGKKFIAKAGNLTIGPFFLHLPLMSLFNKCFRINNYYAVYRLCYGNFIFFLSLLITIALRKNKFLKYIVP